MGAVGIAILDFGNIPGTNFVTVVVTGQSGILSNSYCEAWMMGDSTATHNAIEHAIVPIKLTCGSVVASTGFTITGMTELRLTGTFSIRWVWN